MRSNRRSGRAARIIITSPSPWRVKKIDDPAPRVGERRVFPIPATLEETFHRAANGD